MSRILKNKKVTIPIICSVLIGIIFVYGLTHKNKSINEIQTKNEISYKKETSKDINDEKNNKSTDYPKNYEHLQIDIDENHNNGDSSNKKESKIQRGIKKFSLLNKDNSENEYIHIKENEDLGQEFGNSEESKLNTIYDKHNNIEKNNDKNAIEKKDSNAKEKTDSNKTDNNDLDINKEVNKKATVNLIVNNKEVIVKVNEVYTSNFKLPMIIFNEESEICYINEIDRVGDKKYSKKFDFSNNPAGVKNPFGKYKIRINTGNGEFVEDTFELK